MAGAGGTRGGQQDRPRLVDWRGRHHRAPGIYRRQAVRGAVLQGDRGTGHRVRAEPGPARGNAAHARTGEVTAPLPSPQPPQASVGFYREHGTDSELFAGLCGLLLDTGATPTGARLALADQAQAFERVSDLQLAQADLTPGAEAGEQLRSLLSG